MILLAALLVGVTVGWLFARWQKYRWTFPSLDGLWLVMLAFLPQGVSFYLPATRTHIPDALASAGLVASQSLLLVFCWCNRRVPGIWLMALGTACNLTVILANGGFMPISPETASRLVSAETLEALTVGSRFGYGKDILLLPEQTRLAWLSDAFLLPEGSPYQVAFSVGDILVGAGAFWLAAFAGRLEARKNSI